MRYLNERSFGSERSALVHSEAAPARVWDWEDASGFKWSHVISVLREEWVLALVFTVAVLFVTILVSRWIPNTYEASVRLEIKVPDAQISTTHVLPPEGKSEFLETQIELLRSEALHAATITTLHLESKPEFSQPRESALFAGLAGPSAGHKSGSTLDYALIAFKKRLSVGQVRNSQIVEVMFKSHDPALAANVANTLAKLFIARNYETAYQSSMELSGSLSGQLAELRKKVERSNQALVEYQRANGIYFDPGDRDSLLNSRVSELNRSLSAAQAERIQIEALEKGFDRGGEGSLPGLSSNRLIQDLRARYADAQSQLAQASVVYGKNNNAVKRLASQVNEYRAQLNAEEQRLARELTSNYKAAVSRERLLDDLVQREKGELGRINERLIQYRVLKDEAQANESLYNLIYGRIKEATVTAGLKSGGIRIVDPARVPARPSKPNRTQIAIFGLIVGMLGGISIGFVRYGMNDAVRTAEELRTYAGILPAAIVPEVSLVSAEQGRKRLALGSGATSAGDPREFHAMLNLSASIELSLTPNGRRPKIILIASPGARDGKTTIAVNLATALAKEHKVCIVDADVRKPEVARALGIEAESGLSEVLRGSQDLESTLRRAPHSDNLSVLPGECTRDFPDLHSWRNIESVIRKLSLNHDFVVIDSAPFLPFADAQMLATLADCVVLVARYGATPRKSLLLTMEMLQDQPAPLVRVVLNGVSRPLVPYSGYGRKS